MTRPSALERFMAKVEVAPSGCWEWCAYIKPNGYGDFRYDGGRWAHRAGYELFRGRIPNDLTVDHLCRNKRCVNPDHLEAVTGAENTRRGKRPWSACESQHPGVSARWGKRERGGIYCKECQRVREANRRARMADETEQRSVSWR